MDELTELELKTVIKVLDCARMDDTIPLVVFNLTKVEKSAVSRAYVKLRKSSIKNEI